MGLINIKMSRKARAVNYFHSIHVCVEPAGSQQLFNVHAQWAHTVHTYAPSELISLE